MADDLLGPIGGFFSSLIDPAPEETQEPTIASSTRVQRTTASVESATPETTFSTSAPATNTRTATSISTSADITSSLTSSSLEPTTIATRTASTPTSSSSTAISSATPTPSQTAVATDPEPSSVNAGAIAGGIVGGLAVLALLAFGTLWLLRRPRKSRADREVHPKSYQGSVVSLVAYGKDVPESRPSTSSPWDTAYLAEPKPMLPAHLNGPSIFVTDETDTKRLVFELPGSEPAQPTVELEGGQKYHAYRPKVS